jgi:hypothetical protein
LGRVDDSSGSLLLLSVPLVREEGERILCKLNICIEVVKILIIGSILSTALDHRKYVL